MLHVAVPKFYFEMPAKTVTPGHLPRLAKQSDVAYGDERSGRKSNKSPKKT
eukprot:m.24512 g.24512  ORF g.24512 m.24512 type:complete len:51 (+) comp4165_c0_seq1:262-414(+)